MVTKYSTKKHDLEHYALSDEINVFLYFYPRFSKMDIYKCPIFKKGLWELKFSYIITLWASAFPFCGGYLYDLIIYRQRGHVATIMVWIYNLLKIVNIFKACPQKTLSCLWKTTFPKLGHLLETVGSKLLRSISQKYTDWYREVTTDLVLSISPNDSWKSRKYWRQNNCRKYLWKFILYFFK
jgi:hypothetical protein